MATNISRFNVSITASENVTQTLRTIEGALKRTGARIEGVSRGNTSAFLGGLAGNKALSDAQKLVNLRSGFRSLSFALRSTTAASYSLSGGFAAAAAASTAIGAAIVGVAAALQGLAKSIKEGARFESAQVAFATLIGDAEVAKKTIEDLTEFAAKTPFELPELEVAARKLLAFGTPVNEVITDLRKLGDIASGTQQPIGEIAELYGKARVEGRAYTRDLVQFQSRGIDILSGLADQFNVPIGQVRKLAEEGKIQFSDIEKAIDTLTSKGGAFFNSTAAQSQTLSGLWSTLKDEFGLLFRDLGVLIIPAVKVVVRGLTEALSLVRTLVNQVRDVLGIEPNFLKNLELGGLREGIKEAERLRNNPFFGTFDELFTRGKNLTIEFQTPEEKFKRTVEELKLLREEGGITQEVFSRAFNKAKEDLQKAIDQQTGLDKLKQKAESVAESVKTPFEKFKDQVAELNQLLANDLISNEQFDRAVAKSAAAFQEQLGTVQKIKQELQNIKLAPLLKRGSVAEIEARLVAPQQNEKLNELKERLEQQNALTQQLIEETKANRIVNVEVDVEAEVN